MIASHGTHGKTTAGFVLANIAGDEVNDVLAQQNVDPDLRETGSQRNRPTTWFATKVMAPERIKGDILENVPFVSCPLLSFPHRLGRCG